MPQILSRMDDASWLTPAIADILEQGAAPPGGDGSLRQYMLQLEQALEQLNTPASIINVRSTPSYILYTARPGSIGRLGNRRTITASEIRRSLGTIAEHNKTWKLGFLSELQGDEDGVGILLRTDQHQSQSLRRLLVRSAFREHPSTLAVVMGITLEQKLIVHDLAGTGHLLLVGAENSKQHFIRGILLTLTMLNTPGELRLALAGQSSGVYKPLVRIPHALGRLLSTPAEGQRLLDGLVKESQRRQNKFQDAGLENIEAYNTLLKEQNQVLLPHILLMIDSLSDPTWQKASDKWAESLEKLLSAGAQTGIYLVFTANNLTDIPDKLQKHLTTRLIMRAAAAVNLGESRLKEIHSSLLRFIDAFVVYNDEDAPIPVELCAVTDGEVQRAVEYWTQTTIQRKQENQMAVVSGKTGVTGILEPLTTFELRTDLPTPPIPEKPHQTTLARATQALSTEEQRTQLESAQALAAYLGWLGNGPLQDVLGLTSDEAKSMLKKLQTMGILEHTNSPTPRFLRAIGQATENR